MKKTLLLSSLILLTLGACAKQNNTEYAYFEDVYNVWLDYHWVF